MQWTKRAVLQPEKTDRQRHTQIHDAGDIGKTKKVYSKRRTLIQRLGSCLNVPWEHGEDNNQACQNHGSNSMHSRRGERHHVSFFLLCCTFLVSEIHRRHSQSQKTNQVLKKTKTTTTISAKVFITGANCPLLRNQKRKPENKTEREREREREREQRQREKRGREHHPLSFLFLFFFFNLGRVSKEYNESWGKRKG